MGRKIKSGTFLLTKKEKLMGKVLIKWDQLGHHIEDIASFIKEKIRKLQNN